VPQILKIMLKTWLNLNVHSIYDNNKYIRRIKMHNIFLQLFGLPIYQLYFAYVKIMLAPKKPKIVHGHSK
jgi:hypothetical protein